MTLAFFVAGRPATAGSKRGFVNPKTGRVIITDDNRKGVDWRNNVRAVCKEVFHGDPLTTPLRLELTFFFDRPKGHYGVKGLRPSAPSHPAVRPDVLKLARAVEDALTGILYKDDSLIVEEVLRKVYGSRPGVEIRCGSFLAPLASRHHAEQPGD